MRTTMNSFFACWLVATVAGCDIHLPASASEALDNMNAESATSETFAAAAEVAAEGLQDYSRCEQLCSKGGDCGVWPAADSHGSCVTECTARGIAGDLHMEATLRCFEEAAECVDIEACQESAGEPCPEGAVDHAEDSICVCSAGQWECAEGPSEDQEHGDHNLSVSDCAVACDAVEACSNESADGCFATCLHDSADPSIQNSVHCILGAHDCGQVMDCAGILAEVDAPSESEHDVEPECPPGAAFTQADGSVCVCTDEAHWVCEEGASNPTEDGAPKLLDAGVCHEICDPAESCGFLPTGHCDEVCAMGAMVSGETVACLFDAGHCGEVFSCLQGGESAPPSAAQQDQECAPGDVSEDGCFCQDDGFWFCEPVDEPAPAVEENGECVPGDVSEDGCFCDEDGAWFCEPMSETGDLEADCGQVCDKIADCNGIPHEFCVQLCLSQFGQEGIHTCFFEAQTCEELDACSNPDASAPVNGAECVPGEVDGEGCFCKDDGHWSCGAPGSGPDCLPGAPCENYEEENDPCDEDGAGCEMPSDEPAEPSDPADFDDSDEPADPMDEGADFDCSDVDIDRELMITDLSVVEDPSRTFDGCVGNPNGAWAFGTLMTHMAGDQDPGEFTLGWLEQWTMDQELNGFVSPARLSIEDQVIQPWMERSGGESLDMAKAPFRLLAIVNRLDLRKTDGGDFHAGEGRFVFGLVDVESGCMPREFVVIFEYGQPAATVAEIQDWAHAWHGLSAHGFGPDYNESLEAVTNGFTGPGADPSKPNGSSINQIRTNEIVLDGPWELREFRVQLGGQLAQVSVKQEPGDELKNAPELAEWINDNEADVLESTHVVPDHMLGPAAPVTGLWAPVGVDNDEARHKFALNTCSGCHQAETGAPFLHVGSRFPGEETPLSAFLVGGSTFDPVSGAMREFNDLERRMIDLCELVDEAGGEEAVHDVDIAPACSAD